MKNDRLSDEEEANRRFSFEVLLLRYDSGRVLTLRPHVAKGGRGYLQFSLKKYMTLFNFRLIASDITKEKVANQPKIEQCKKYVSRFLHGS